MAGDWIKMRVNLDTDPRILSIAGQLAKEELHVVGMLWKIWSWADGHSLDGNALTVTNVTLDRFVNCPGFADALRKVGWLEGRDSALTFPRFAEHNGQTAKQRALTSQRVERNRSKKCNAASVTQSLPEKRREEDISILSNTEEEPNIPPKEEGGDAQTPPKEEEKEVPIPPALDSARFHAAWESWVQNRRDLGLKKYTPRGKKGQFKMLAEMGEDRAVAAIEFSITQNYQGIYEQHASQPGRNGQAFAGNVHGSRRFVEPRG